MKVRLTKAFLAKAQAAVEAGKCPLCGVRLQHLQAGTYGWVQCGAYPLPDQRHPSHRHFPQCTFQAETKELNK